MTTERDTHFQGFAKSQFQRMLSLHGCLEGDNAIAPPDYEQFLAQCAYDLVLYTLNYLGIGPTQHSYDPMGYNKPEDIPDLTEWPKESE